MAKILENSKGFKVIALDKEDAKKLEFGLANGSCLCTHCHNYIKGDINFIAVLNDTMCTKCYKDWLTWAKRFPEDIQYEERLFNLYKKELNLK